jgi:hypothetical protein
MNGKDKVSINTLINSAITDFHVGLKKNKSRNDLLLLLATLRKRLIMLSVLCQSPFLSNKFQANIAMDRIRIEGSAIEECANALYATHNMLQNAPMSIDLKTAIDVLYTGKYRQLPFSSSNTNNRSDTEVIQRLEEIMRVELLVNERIHNNFEIDDGKVVISTPKFTATLSLLIGAEYNTWRLLGLVLSPQLQDHVNIGQIQQLIVECQKILDKTKQNILRDLKTHLDVFCTALGCRILLAQAIGLAKDKWNGFFTLLDFSSISVLAKSIAIY